MCNPSQTCSVFWCYHPVPISPEFFKLLDIKKAERVFKEIKNLACTFLLSDEYEIKRLLDLETRDR